LAVAQNPRQPRQNKPEIGLRTRALSLLARREYSRPELARKLAQYAENPDDIPELLDDFERRGWLSERRVVEQVLVARRGRFGIHRIVHELREKGVSDAAIAGAQQQLKDGEFEAAREVWRKKFGEYPIDARDKARQMRFLQGRGFSSDVIQRLLRDTEV
jgi:regulatory protein